MSAPNADQLTDGPILPRSTCKLVGKVSSRKRHPGLQLDKLSPVGNGKMEAQKVALVEAIRTLRDERLLKDLLARRTTTLNALGAQRLPMTTRGPLTLHLSRSGALENAGIALHPVYGFVYLPGSGIKGLVRAWAETVWAVSQIDKRAAWRQIEEAFGWSPGSERHKQDWRPNTIASPEGSAAGRLVFHDAWPTRWPRLVLDVINNHHINYYTGEDDPGDWENPTLVYFLAVGGGEEFVFAISDRKRGDGEFLLLARDWLRAALTIDGAGAKTAAGYGRFKPVGGQLPSIPETLTSADYELRLASPGFLAGANQKGEDCDLRAATLRGLLRWWWRTMHAGHLDRCSLSKLETAVWGDAQSGSPVRIAVDPIEVGEPEQYDRRDRQRDLPKPNHRQRVTQGLFYAAYGMAEGRERNRWRWYRPPGSRWRVTLTAKSGRFDAGSDKRVIRLSSKRLLEQAAAALWLLARFGGAGSRSRKGFGSFDDITVHGILAIEHCIASAKRFRQACRLNGPQPRRVNVPDLEAAKELIVESDTSWTDPWYALDQTGLMLQLFAKQELAPDERIALGLPRRIGRNGRSLKSTKGDRHASPALWSLATADDGKLTVRLIAFPAACLPDGKTSRAILRKLLDFTETELRRQAEKAPPAASRRNQRRGSRGRTTASRRQSVVSRRVPTNPLPKAKDRVEAEILEEKTRKGGWKAKHVDGGLKGPIQDTGNVPADVQPGQRVQLTVAFANPTEIAFTWAEPRMPKKKSGRRAGWGSGGKHRRRYR